MRVESLDCNKCGAPLEVPEGVNFARCAHCGSRLRVHRETSVHYTEVLGKIEQSTRRLEGEVREMRLQLALRDLDDGWNKQRETLMHRGQNGELWEPSIFWAACMYGLAGLVVIFTILIAYSGQVGPSECFIPALIGVLSLGFGFYLHGKAHEYTRAKSAYEAKRRRLLMQMGTAGARKAV